MAETSSIAMSKLFSDLTGQHVTFSEQQYPISTTAKQIYCVYLIKPMDSTRVIKADVPLLTSFAGALIGLPLESIKERVADSRPNEALRDSLYEVMNIASRIVSVEHRAVFNGMYPSSIGLPPDALKTLRDPCSASYFNVTIDSYEGGALSLLSPW